MKIVIVNDQHFDCRNSSLHFLDYFEKFYSDVLFPYIDEHRITRVVDLGDSFDRRKFVNINSLYRARKMWYDPLLEREIHLDMLVGNHNAYFRNTNEVNSVDNLIGGHANMVPIAHPTEMVIDGLPILYLPWINVENQDETFAMMNDSKSSVIFGHLEIAGFEMDRGNVSLEGFDRSLFDKFDKVISGHYHHKSDNGKIFYLGTQYEMTWADYEDPKGFHVFDTGSLELEFVPNPYRMFHKLWYDDTVEDLDVWMSKDLSEYRGTYLKLIVTNKSNHFAFDRVVDLIMKTCPADLQIVEDYGTIHAQADHVIDQAQSTQEILSKYIDNLKIDGEVDVVRLKQEINELYIESLHANG